MNTEGSKPAAAGPVTPVTEGGAVQSVEGAGEPLHLLLDDIKDYAVFMLSLDGTIASWNSGAEHVKGFTSEEAIGQPFSMLFTPEDVEKGVPAQEIEHAIKHGLFTGVGTRQKKDGTRFYADVTLRLIKDRAGKPLGLVKVTRDITERKRLEELQRDRTDFERQLIGIVSHDLRNPLSAIMLSASLLQSRGGLEGRQQKGLDRIMSSAQRAQRLVGELLDFTQARLGGGLSIARTDVSVAELIGDVTEELRVVHPERQFDVDCESAGRATWDGDRVEQLIGNLVNNAVKHGAERPIKIILKGRADHVVISVHNFGEPISESLIPHLFEPMKQGTRARSGKTPGSIGLGLFIVHHVAAAHGGSVKVHSTAEAGTTFTVTLPRQPEAKRSNGQPRS